MAAKKKKNRSRSRAASRALSIVRNKPRRRRGSRGGAGKYGVAMPTVDALKIGVAMAAGELLLLLIESKTGIDIPDWIPASSLGLFVYAWWFKDRQLQQVAYALAVMDFVKEQDVFQKAKAQVLAP